MYHSAANLTVSVSKAESLPQFIVETILCNNPVVAFNVGGTDEIVKHKYNGYLAKTYDTSDFAHGINYWLNKANQKNLLLANKKTRRMFNQKSVLKKYSSIINRLN